MLLAILFALGVRPDLLAGSVAPHAAAVVAPSPLLAAQPPASPVPPAVWPSATAAPTAAAPPAGARSPAPQRLDTPGRPRVSHRADPQKAGARKPLMDVDLLAPDAPGGAAQAASHLEATAEANARLQRLLDRRALRLPGGPALLTGGPRRAAAGKTGPAPIAAPAGEKALPWSSPGLLADPNHSNDQYVSLAAHPTNGHLYAVFESYDLGATDRDIHIARSTDGGLTWSVWEMPSFSLDECMPDLAIDAAGFLHVTWIRADGMVVRARSANADNPLTWAWVRGLATGSLCATPSIAVSGAGDFARVFIAASMVDWGEWTLLWMHSTNGGATIAYDYYYADGYPDLWPDVAINGATVYLVNGEQNGYTGEVEILLAADALSGTFAQPINLTAWTANSCGFPAVAASGAEVFCVFQLDYDDGLGHVDGDIIYCFSWDGLANVYGPYELAADPRESLGPALCTRGGTVGCLFLDAPHGGDEFRLAARLAGGSGHPESWLGLEIVNDLFMTAPTFRSAAAAIGAAAAAAGGVPWLHAAWIDRRDYPTQGLNVYRSRRAPRPNLTPYQPSGWSGPLVASLARGGRQTDATLAAGDTAWISLALANDGLAAASGDVVFRLTLDGALAGAWYVPGGLAAGTYAMIEDHPLVAGAGFHDLALLIDPEDACHEEDEGDNVWLENLYWVTGTPRLRFSPGALRLHAAAPGAKMASELAAAPPLLSAVHLPVVSPRLADACAAAPADALLPVIIEPAVRVDAPELKRRLDALGSGPAGSLGIDSGTRRELAVAALRGQTERAGAALAAAHRGLQERGLLSSPAPLWLPGLLAVRASADAVAALSADPLVGRLWLDDTPSRPFAPAGAGGGSATVVARDHGAGDAHVAPAPSTLVSAALAWHLERIGAPEAWAQGLDGAGVIVGHLDTGVAWDHPDLAGRLWDGGPAYPRHGYDFVDEDADPYDGDTSWWHGTHTAGLVVGGDAAGMATGAAPGARLMALRCVPGYLQDMNEALQFALDHGARVMTMSAGWTDPPPELRAANRATAEALLAAGVPWFCAAGNGDNAGGHLPAPRDVSSPADCPEPTYGAGGHTAVIAVGAVDAAETVWNLSSRGPTSWSLLSPPSYGDYPYPPGLTKPDLAAPGVNITSTRGGGGHVAYSGTSMATPLAAAAAAILLQARPTLSPPELAAALAAGAVDVDVPGRDERTGAGRLHIPGALAHLPGTQALAFWICNDGVLPLRVTDIVSDAAWLEATPRQATIAPADSARFTALLDPAGLPAGLHHALLTVAANAPAAPHRLPVTLAMGDVTGLDDGYADGRPPTPGATPLAARPNPFNPRTMLRFILAAPGPARLSLHDLGGRRLRVLVDADLPAGDHQIVWDGRDGAGRPLPSGVYMARLEGPAGLAAAAKLTLVR